MAYRWHQITTLPSKSFTCSYCGEKISSNVGYCGNHQQGGRTRYIYICHNCDNATYFNEHGKQSPGATFGEIVKNLPTDIGKLYDDARNSYSCGAFTSSVMCCRKLLMNVSVVEGADEGKIFVYYVDYLKDHHYISPNGEKWVDKIRTLGNEANHEIALKEEKDARLIILFSQVLLKHIYELPSMIEDTNP